MKSKSMNPLEAPEPEQETIRRCLAGDMSAFRLLYDRHKTVLFNVALRLHQSVPDAEDSVQEAFLKMFTALPGFKGESRFSTWMYRILVNTCISKLRMARLPVCSLEHLENVRGGGFRSAGEDASVKMILEQEIGRLSLGHRTVFVLYEVEGFSHSEIAGMLDITVGTSKSQLHKAKRILQRRLRPFLEVLEVER
jgi:RNA polymerase sigma-70 factor (ECF subfamily)